MWKIVHTDLNWRDTLFYHVCLTFVIIKFDVSCVFSFVDPYTLLGPLVGRLSSTGNNCHFIYFHVHLKKFVSPFFSIISIQRGETWICKMYFHLSCRCLWYNKWVIEAYCTQASILTPYNKALNMHGLL